METETIAWIFIGCAVWSVMTGAMLVHCCLDERSIFIWEEEETLTREKGNGKNNCS